MLYVLQFREKQRWNECLSCVFHADEDCEVIQGREPPMECPGLQDLIQFEGIKLKRGQDGKNVRGRGCQAARVGRNRR